MSGARPGRLVLGYVCEHVLLDQADLTRICERYASSSCQETYALCRLSVERLSTSTRARQAVREELRGTEARSVPGLQRLLALGGQAGAIEHIRSCVDARLLVAGTP